MAWLVTYSIKTVKLCKKLKYTVILSKKFAKCGLKSNMTIILATNSLMLFAPGFSQGLYGY